MNKIASILVYHVKSVDKIIYLLCSWHGYRMGFVVPMLVKFIVGWGSSIG